MAIFLFLILLIVAGFILSDLFDGKGRQAQPATSPTNGSASRPSQRPTTPNQPHQGHVSTRTTPALRQVREPKVQAAQPRQQPSSRKSYSSTDLIGLVGFHDFGFVVARPAEPFAGWLQERAQSFPDRVAGNGTNITDGLRKGVELLKDSPRDRIRRIWLLTDGMPNMETGELMAVVQDACRHRININTIGFGSSGSVGYDEGLLKKIAGATHNGRFVPVDSLRALSNALKGSNRVGLGNRRPETTILVIDCSGSMTFRMEKKRRIEVVVEAITHLLHYKQKCFS